MKITKETIGGIAKIGFAAAGATLAIVASKLKDRNASYSDAVTAIMDSDMFSVDKNAATKALKKDGDAEFYRAVIKIAKSTMFSCDRFKLIVELSEGEGS